MKKFILIIFLLNSFVVLVFSDVSSSFFLQNRTGVLVKVDPASGTKSNYPKKKGPTFEQIPREIEISKFENEYLSMIDIDLDREFVLSCYERDDLNGKYLLKKGYIPENISQTVLKETVLNNLVGIQKTTFNKYYKFDNKRYKYVLKNELDDKDKETIANNVPILVLRCIFLYYNKDNEMYVDLDSYGSPSPHKFPRLSEAKSKALFDIHFVWGGKWEDPDDPSKNVSLSFALNLTNFVMLSLEISLKYNFIVPDYPFSPYIGGALYGGFWDGFPIGLNLIGGSDIFPTYMIDKKTNFYVLGEARVGAVFLSGIYFDTGYDYEGIWKKFKILLEGGFYTGVGYRFDEIVSRF